MLESLLQGMMRKAARHHCSKPFAMRNHTPLVSFTFDDVPDSAYTNGATVLETFGVRGTFYIAGGLCGTTEAHRRLIGNEQVRALHHQGHEIGCHTFSHVPVERLDAQAMEWELLQNRNHLREVCPNLELTNFCYPFGRASLPRKLQLQKRFDTCRGIYEGINAGVVDLGMLRVIELYDRTLTAEKFHHVVRQTRERNGWLIFYTHDVTDAPSSIGCSPHLLRETVEAVQTAGVPCLTIREALATIGVSQA